MLQLHRHAISSGKPRRGQVLRPPSSGGALSAIVLLTVLLSAPVRGQGGTPTNNSNAVRQANVNPHTVKLPLVDGDDIRFSRLSTTAGLSQTRVAQIVQDDQGFMWFGTQYGLNRYDGHKFKVFTPDPSRVNSLSGAYIYALFKDRSGMFWIGCDQYLDRFDPTTERFTHYLLQGYDGKGIAVTVSQISQDRAGILWLATGNGLYGFNPETGRMTEHYVHDPLNPLSLSSNDIRSTGEDQSARFWVADGSTLEQFDRSMGIVTLRVSLAQSARDFSFYEDHSGILWIGYSGGEGFAALDPKSDELTHYSFYDQKSKKALAASVFAMLEDKDGTFWLGTMGAGLLKFDRAHETVIRYRNHPNELESIAEDRVIALAQDREGNIWAGLHATEPNFFATKKPSFSSPLRESLNPNSLGEHLVNAIYEDRQGILWAGTTGALVRIDRKTGRYTFYRPPGVGLDNDIVAITEDRSGVMWVGTIGQGFSRFNPKTGQFKTYLHNPADPSSLSNDAVVALFVDHTGTIWLGTWDGLDRFDPGNGRFVVYKRDLQSQENYVDIAEDRNGELWLGGTSGLQRFDPATGEFTGYQHKLHDPNSLSDNRVTSVYIDQFGSVWAATENGLDKLDLKSGTFTAYYVKDGLPTNGVHCILGDQHGNLWISTNQGLSEYDEAANKFKNYSVADGLPGLDLTGWHTCFKSQTGELFFGGFSGATAFYPDNIVGSSYIPPIVFTDFQLSGHPVEIGNGSPLTNTIGYSNNLTLSHAQSTFSLEFAALSYSNSSLNRYRYKLDGLDSQWNEAAGDPQVVNYTALPPGKYTFRAEIVTGQSGGSPSGATLRIEVLPPWSRSWWFETTCAGFIVLIAFAAYSYRMHQVAWLFEMRLEERVSERTRIARELHDTLLQSFHGLLFRLQAARNVLPRRPEEAVQALDGAIARAEHAIAEGRDAIQGLRSAPADQRDLEHLLTAMGRELGGSQDAGRDSPTFRVTAEGAQQTLSPILQDEVYRIAREVIGNAFRHANASRIEAEIRYDDRLLRLRIRDDGKGIDPKVLKERERTGHWGLPGIRERAKQMGARLDFWSEAGAGTEVELTVPASVAYAKSPDGSSRDDRGFRLFRKTRSHEHRS